MWDWMLNVRDDEFAVLFISHNWVYIENVVNVQVFSKTELTVYELNAW